MGIRVHVVILGCGRVGSAIAHTLEARGHGVAVVDQDSTAFHRLGPEFRGVTVTGIGFDRDTLIEAGIERASAFAAVSSGDNSNILAARVARETFGVDTVVARIYDPRRADVYERLGIPTVATVRWTAEQMIRRLLPGDTHTEWTDPGGSVALVESSPGSAWVGHRLREIQDATGVRVAFLTRLGEGMVPTGDTILQHGDVLHVAVAVERVEECESLLASGPGAAS
jgi:trk system potassium uptake protein TrkA